MATGFHAAKTAEVKEGDTVVVMGDGAVGLCGVIGAKLLGAKRIITMSRHADRQALAREFGATDIVEERGDKAVAKVMELTNNAGADAVLECVGREQSVQTATQICRLNSSSRILVFVEELLRLQRMTRRSCLTLYFLDKFIQERSLQDGLTSMIFRLLMKSWTSVKLSNHW